MTPTDVLPIVAADRRIRSKFAAFVDADIVGAGCWLWRGGRQSKGYGTLYVGKHDNRYRTVLAHRLAYTIVAGAIPKGMELDHLCRTPLCVNPAHLEPVSHKVNMERGAIAARTHCQYGHAIDGWREDRRHRYCRPCSVEHVRQYRINNPGCREGEWARWFARRNGGANEAK